MRSRAFDLRDLTALVLLVLLNPVLYFLGSSPRFFPPDTIKYLALARELMASGSLSVAGMGHVDTLTILPPLYPAFIGIGSLFTDHLLAWAESIASFSLLLTAVPLYLLLSACAPRWLAFAVVAVTQLAGAYFDVAFWPLTESLFILLATTALYLLQRSFLPDSGKPVAFAAGLLVGLTFLSRQIGLLMIGVPFLLALLGLMKADSMARRHSTSRAVLILVGFSVLVAPYSLALYQQTGSHPLTQSVRMGDYLVEATASDQARLQGTMSGEVGEYSDVYERRRVLRELNAEGSEMLGSLGAPRGGGGESATGPDQSRVLRRIENRFRNMRVNLVSNLGHLENLFGRWPFWIFLASLFMPFVTVGRTSNHRAVSALWLWILVYLAGVSWITGLVERYLVVLLPFGFAHIGLVAHWISRAFLGGKEGRWVKPIRAGGWVAVFALLVLGTPRYFPSTTMHDKLWEDAPSLDPVRELLTPGEPVFSIQPLEAYFAGALWRTLPNDNLDRIANYGRLTGVRWVLVSRLPTVVEEARLYSNAQWYWDPSLTTRTGLPVRFRVSSTDGLFDLYEIR